MIAALLFTLFALCLIFAFLRWRPAEPERSLDIPRPRQVHALWTRAQPGDRIVIRDKRGRGERRTRLLTIECGRLVCQTSPLARPFRRPLKDLVRLEVA